MGETGVKLLKVEMIYIKLGHVVQNVDVIQISLCYQNKQYFSM